MYLYLFYHFTFISSFILIFILQSGSPSDPVRGHSLMTPTSAHLQSPPTYIHISLLSVHSYTYYYSLSSPTSPTFGDVAVHIPFPSSSFHTVPFPISMIL